MKRTLFSLIFCFAVFIAFYSTMSFALEAEDYTISEAYTYPIPPPEPKSGIACPPLMKRLRLAMLMIT